MIFVKSWRNQAQIFKNVANNITQCQNVKRDENFNISGLPGTFQLKKPPKTGKSIFSQTLFVKLGRNRTQISKNVANNITQCQNVKRHERTEFLGLPAHFSEKTLKTGKIHIFPERFLSKVGEIGSKFPKIWQTILCNARM